MDESIKNILQALYEDSEIIKKYVDAVADGNAVPYTILIRDTEVNKNLETIQKLTDLYNEDHAFLNYSGRDWFAEIHSLLPNLPIPVWALEEWPDLMKSDEDKPGAIECEVIMYKDGVIVSGSRQIVSDENQIESLRKFAEFKGYEISVKPVK